MLIDTITEITIYEVEVLYARFFKELENSHTCNVDLQHIEKIDVVGIQLLISFIKSAKAIDKIVTFDNITESAMQQINACQFAQALGLSHE